MGSFCLTTSFYMPSPNGGAVGESINEYTNKALRARMGLEEWPKDDAGSNET